MVQVDVFGAVMFEIKKQNFSECALMASYSLRNPRRGAWGKVNVSSKKEIKINIGNFKMKFRKKKRLEKVRLEKGRVRSFVLKCKWNVKRLRHSNLAAGITSLQTAP